MGVWIERSCVCGPGCGLEDGWIGVVEIGADGKNGLGMNLADPGFRDTEQLGNFAQTQIFKIIERKNLALIVRQDLEPVHDEARQFPIGGPVARMRLRGVRERFPDGHGRARFVATNGVDTNERGGTDVIEEFKVFMEGEVECSGHFSVGGNTGLALFELLHDILDFARFVMHRAGHPIQPPQLIEDGAANAETSVRFERGACRGIEASNGVKEPRQTRAVKIVEKDVGGEGKGKTTDDRFDKWQVMNDKVILRVAAVAGDAVEIPELRRFVGGTGRDGKRDWWGEIKAGAHGREEAGVTGFCGSEAG
jgi:hypothetical protein